MSTKNVYIIAGPNGSGKTTFARLFLPEYVRCTNFVNADLIAQGLAPFNPGVAAIKAGKLVLRQIHEFFERGNDFAFETTLAGKLYVRLLREMRAKEYHLHIFFLWIPSSELAIARIKERVAEGGHDVPAQDVRRRFDRSARNFFTVYKPISNSWMVFNNAGPRPVLMAKGKNGHSEVIDEHLYESFRRESI